MEYALFEKVRDEWCLLWTYGSLKAVDADLAFYRDVLGLTVCVMGRKRTP